MRRISLLAAVCLLCTCNDDEGLSAARPEGGVVDARQSADAGSPDTSDGGNPDRSMDGAADAMPGAALTSCLDTPDELPRPPTEQLPCDLIPPGLTL